MITEASGVLAVAGAELGAPAHFSQVTVVVPPAWTEADCRVKISAPGRGLAHQVRIVWPVSVKYFRHYAVVATNVHSPFISLLKC